VHPNAGRLHADHAVAALQLAARKRGAVVRTRTRVASLRIGAGRKTAVVTIDDDELTADFVVVAPGGWAPKLLGGLLPDLPPLRVTQEQPAHFPPLNPADPWPSFIHHPGAGLEDGEVYGLGSVDGIKVGFHAVGPVIDPDHRDRSIDPGRVATLQAYAEQWLPGVDASAPAPLTCLYTLTPDHNFVVDRRGPLIVLAGFSGHGFKFGPAIGELAVKLAIDDAPPPDRFALGPGDGSPGDGSPGDGSPGDGSPGDGS
jgi:sarcosine oxidase